MLNSVNPSTGETLGTVRITPPDEVFQRIQKARNAQKQWAAVSIKERIRFIRRFQVLLAERAESFADLITHETGKCLVDSLSAEILPTLLYVDYVCKNAAKLLKERKISSGFMLTTESRVQYLPYGVVGIVSPWNFPVYITMCSAIAALAAGNTVITKPSEFTPLSVEYLEKLFHESGFPEDVFQVVPGNVATGQALIDGRVDRFVFTGSTAIGKKVAVACAEKLIPVSLELGGKDPMIILEDAPMPRTVYGAIAAGLCHAGQMCMSVERIYVQKSIAESFIKNVVNEVSKLRLGTEISPIQNKPQLEKIEAQVSDAVKLGATLLLGGKRREGSNFFEPTVLTNLSSQSPVIKEETFGPVLAIMTFETEEEAVRLANDSPFGLTASVWSGDPERAKRIANKLDVGSVFINDHLSPAVNPHAPWGGMKESGIGTERGEWGIYSMVKIRHVSRNRFLMSKDPFWFPRTDRQKQLALGLIQGLFGSKLLIRLKSWLSILRSSA